MIRLGTDTLNALPRDVTENVAIDVPCYPRQLDKRICHFGLGGFHRSHQALYLHELLQKGRADGWGICGIAFMPGDLPLFQALLAQGGLYSLWTFDNALTGVTVVGSVMELVDATDSSAPALDKLCDPATEIASLTITEKGYYLTPEGRLDLDNPIVQHDINNPDSPCSVIGTLVRALQLRYEQNLPPFTVMSCDNLINNGDHARTAVVELARRQSPELAQWIQGRARFPSSMVDRITPAPLPQRCDRLRTAWGVNDRALLVCEHWKQWVLEDQFSLRRPPFEAAGVQFTDDVAAFEKLKIGLLNGAHTALAQLGLLLGYETVHDAASDRLICDCLAAYMSEVEQTLPYIPGTDIHSYKQALIARFGNAAIEDSLFRLAEDSSAKITQCLLPALLEQATAGREITFISGVLALWMELLAALDKNRIPRDRYHDHNVPGLISLATKGVNQGQSKEFMVSVFALPPHLTNRICGAVDRHLGLYGKSGAYKWAQSLLI